MDGAVMRPVLDALARSSTCRNKGAATRSPTRCIMRERVCCISAFHHVQGAEVSQVSSPVAAGQAE